mmetsp:Transcript_61209/g.171201  ORF Transcript_61209/g.171201 Transcript_61209/m.171201 type:complete len:193 (-) Transcript_61209:18-596(-)
MYIISLLIATLVSVTAFAPAGRTAKSSMKMAFAGGLPGADGPEMKTFDPLKFSENSPEWVPWFRESELKHGRIAMLATAGFVATDLGVRLPGDVHDVSSVDAHNAAVSSGAMIQILLWCSVIEIITTPITLKLFDKDNDRAPGYFGFDPLGFGKKDMKKLEVNELKNGRLAMMAFSGIVTQAVLNGKGFPYF